METNESSVVIWFFKICLNRLPSLAATKVNAPDPPMAEVPRLKNQFKYTANIVYKMLLHIFYVKSVSSKVSGLLKGSSAFLTDNSDVSEARYPIQMITPLRRQINKTTRFEMVFFLIGFLGTPLKLDTKPIHSHPR